MTAGAARSRCGAVRRGWAAHAASLELVHEGVDKGGGLGDVGLSHVSESDL